MNQIIIKPYKLCGELVAPPSKSYSHRALIAAALCDAPSTIDNIVLSQDVRATKEALSAFGAKIHSFEKSCRIVPMPLTRPRTAIDCRESASTLRFLLPLALLVEGGCSFTGRAALIGRPLDDYVELFKAHDCIVDYDGKLPISLKGSPLQGEISISGAVSSQYISGLLFALPLSGAAATIKLTEPLQSRDYVAMTIDVLAQYGIKVESLASGWHLAAKQRYRATDYRVEGDYSNAAFWLVAATLGERIVIRGLNPNSLQGDRRIVDIINRMGGDVKASDDALIANPAQTHGIDLDISNVVDLVPVIALLAALSKGQTRLYNGARLRLKESDRIKSTVEQLRALGADIVETADGMIIRGVSALRGGIVDSCGDHRIAMMLSVAASVCQQSVTLQNAAVVAKSYPNFYEDFAALRGIYE
ncbi:MAG: 3-phosphoshikimate 1-carboxyvinyltransferase [Clostridiales bacterium]|nr:MAG: 3-phosphoshikimate 1-carboxyvinyltransferase [Clostridiales bacterium]